MTTLEIHANALRNHDKPYCPPMTTCPKCGERCPCCHWVEVDIGVGIQVGDEEWVCRMHGVFGFGVCTGKIVFQDDGLSSPDSERGRDG